MYALYFNESKEDVTKEYPVEIVHAEVDETGIVTIYGKRDSKGNLWYFTLSPADVKMIKNAEKV
jgi:hypothetical protein